MAVDAADPTARKASGCVVPVTAWFESLRSRAVDPVSVRPPGHVQQLMQRIVFLMRSPLFAVRVFRAGVPDPALSTLITDNRTREEVDSWDTIFLRKAICLSVSKARLFG